MVLPEENSRDQVSLLIGWAIESLGQATAQRNLEIDDVSLHALHMGTEEATPELLKRLGSLLLTAEQAGLATPISLPSPTETSNRPRSQAIPEAPERGPLRPTAPSPQAHPIVPTHGVGSPGYAEYKSTTLSELGSGLIKSIENGNHNRWEKLSYQKVLLRVQLTIIDECPEAIMDKGWSREDLDRLFKQLKNRLARLEEQRPEGLSRFWHAFWETGLQASSKVISEVAFQKGGPLCAPDLCLYSSLMEH